jgi:hypothetical protein
MAFTNGQTVVQVLPTAITGTVDGFGFDSVTGVVTVLVGYKDADGNDQQRYFQQNEIDAVVTSK